MTDRLDRIEAILQTTAEKQARHADEIDTLLGAVSTTEVAVNNLVAEMAKTNAAVAESNQRFENLRQDAIADRQETAQKFNDAIAQMNTDRQRSDERYQTQLEVIQSLLMALGRTNRDVGEVETAVGRLDDRVDTLEQAS
jgi:chromosome segregation ATPase